MQDRQSLTLTVFLWRCITSLSFFGGLLFYKEGDEEDNQNRILLACCFVAYFQLSLF